MFLIFLWSIFIHELTHIIISWYQCGEIPKIRVNSRKIIVYPTQILSYKEKSIFLGVPIISGMFSLYPFFYIYSVETSLSMIAYLISCGKDFSYLIKMEVIKNKMKRMNK